MFLRYLVIIRSLKDWFRIKFGEFLVKKKKVGDKNLKFVSKKLIFKVMILDD